LLKWQLTETIIKESVMKRAISLLTILVFMASILSTLNAKTIFYDDFEKDLSNWKILAGTVTIVEDDTAKGNHVMDFNGAGQNIVAKDETFRDLKDYVIEIRGRAVEALQWTEVVILFRVQGDNSKYYQAYTNVASFDTNLVLNNGAAFVNFTAKAGLPIKVGQWFKKKVIVEGNNIQLFIDDVKYLDEKRSDLDNGTFGSRSATVHVQYDDWHVYDLSGPSITPGAVEKGNKLAVSWGKIKS
jgi:hypothetical protein